MQNNTVTYTQLHQSTGFVPPQNPAFIEPSINLVSNYVVYDREGVINIIHPDVKKSLTAIENAAQALIKPEQYSKETIQNGLDACKAIILRLPNYQIPLDDSVGRDIRKLADEAIAVLAHSPSNRRSIMEIIAAVAVFCAAGCFAFLQTVLGNAPGFFLTWVAAAVVLKGIFSQPQGQSNHYRANLVAEQCKAFANWQC